MKEQRYNLTCSLVVEPKQQDRFYMDLRVYTLKHLKITDAEEGHSLIWRGIYLAYQANNDAEKRLPHAGENNLWS